MSIKSKLLLFYKKHKSLIHAILAALILYLLFYYRMYTPGRTIWGSDAEVKHFPARWYLFHEIWDNHRFPFWSEKMFGGFPIYADSELGYLNPLNLISLLILGPELSMEFIHLFSYLVGAISFYYLFKRLGYSFLGYLAGITTFFFSYFMLNHIFHINLMYIVLLFPLNILLADLAVEQINRLKYRKAFIYSFLNSLVFAYGFYWGHYQISFLIFLSVVIYTLVSVTKGKWSKYMIALVSLFFIGISAVIISLPQTLPTFEVYLQSGRFVEDKVSYYQGVPSPSLFSLVVYPQIWGDFKNFSGKTIDGAYSYTEMYVYVGISAFLLAFIAFLFLKIDKINKFFYISFVIFMFLTFIGYIPVVDGSTPLIGSFRYWIRSIVIFTLASSILIARFFSQKKISKNKPTSYILKITFLILPFSLLYIVSNWNPRSLYQYQLFQENNYKNYLVTEMGIIWMTVILFTIILSASLVLFKKNRYRKFFTIALFFVLLLDLRYFGDEVIKTRIHTKDKIPVINIPKDVENLRVMFAGGDRSLAMKALYHNVWSPMGYSQYAPADYVESFRGTGVGITKSVGNPGLPPEESFVKFSEIGIVGFYDYDQKTFHKTKDFSPIPFINQISSIYESSYYIADSGNLKFNIKIKEEAQINSTIKYSPNMHVYVNNKKVESIKNGLFLSFNLPAGDHVVQIKYFPRLFYYGVIVMFGYLFIILLIFSKPVIPNLRVRLRRISESLANSLISQK